MSTEWKIGIVLGVIIVVVAAVFFTGQDQKLTAPEPIVPVKSLPEPVKTQTPVAPPEPVAVTPPAVESDAEMVTPTVAAEPAEPVEVVVAPAVKADVPLQPARQERYYVVKDGDSLYGIAQTYYGQGSKFPVIVQANAGKIAADRPLQPGMRLRIPWPSEVAQKTSGR